MGPEGSRSAKVTNPGAAQSDAVCSFQFRFHRIEVPQRPNECSNWYVVGGFPFLSAILRDFEFSIFGRQMFWSTGMPIHIGTVAHYTHLTSTSVSSSIAKL